MNAPFSSSPILTPLHALWRWLMAQPQSVAHAQSALPVQPAHSCTLRTQVLNSPSYVSSRSAMRQPLRVLRVVDPGLAPAQTGRLRISGRMADVCAELDRLAALESSYR